MEEEFLVERAQRGDQRAMEELYQAHSGRVYTVVRRLVGHDALAEDVSQDAWIRAFQRISQFRGDSSFGTWIYRLATNTALNRLRRLKRRPEVEAPPQLSSTAPPPDEIVLNRHVLSRALDAMPGGYRRVLVLHDVEGWTHDEIAEELGIASGTSKSQLHKARARMRELLTARVGRDEAENDV